MLSRKNEDRVGEQRSPVDRAAIVVGRPPGSGQRLGEIPRGIEVLIKKASVDAAFRALLLARRSAAADEIGLTLEPAEAMMLDIVPADQLEAIIAQTRVEPGKKPAFLGKAAAVMLVALGASSFSAPAQVGSDNGIRAVVPTSAPAPASQPASQPTSAPAVTREQIMPILKQLDADAYKERDAAQKKLESLGIGALQPLREILKSETLSAEVVSRVKTAMWDLKATTRPALLDPPPQGPARIYVSGGARPLEPTPAPPTEKPED